MSSEEGWAVDPGETGCRVESGPAHVTATVRFLVGTGLWETARQTTVQELTSQAQAALGGRPEVKEYTSVRRLLDAAAERVAWHARELEVAQLEKRILELRRPADVEARTREIDERIAELERAKEELEKRVETLTPQLTAKLPALDRAIGVAAQDLQTKVGKHLQARRAEALARLPRVARVVLDEVLAAEAGLAVLADSAALADILRATTAAGER